MKIILIILISLSFLGCTTKEKTSVVPFYNTPDFSAEWIPEGTEDFDNIHTIKPFELKNQDGLSISNEKLKGKIYAANFFFTTCSSICPKMTNNLTLVHDKFKDNNAIQLLSFTVLPWVDTIDKLKTYSSNQNINSKNWHFLTGEKEIIYDLARTSFFAEKRFGYQKKSDEFIHTENVILVDTAGRLRGVYNATLPAEVKRMIEDMDILLKGN